eukprot:2213569-Prymnesium_polylepis.1
MAGGRLALATTSMGPCAPSASVGSAAHAASSAVKADPKSPVRAEQSDQSLLRSRYRDRPLS